MRQAETPKDDTRRLLDGLIKDRRDSRCPPAMPRRNKGRKNSTAIQELRIKRFSHSLSHREIEDSFLYRDFKCLPNVPYGS